jgi:hypothetical protein
MTPDEIRLLKIALVQSITFGKDIFPFYHRAEDLDDAGGVHLPFEYNVAGYAERKGLLLLSPEQARRLAVELFRLADETEGYR